MYSNSLFFISKPDKSNLIIFCVNEIFLWLFFLFLLVSSSIYEFEPIEGVEEDTYILCYSAIVSINLENHIDFKNALQFSDNMIIVHIGFKDSNGNELDDVCEGNIDIPVELVKNA